MSTVCFHSNKRAILLQFCCRVTYGNTSDNCNLASLRQTTAANPHTLVMHTCSLQGLPSKLARLYIYNIHIQVQLICLSHRRETKIQTDQSNVNYPKLSPSMVNLISQFVFCFSVMGLYVCMYVCIQYVYMYVSLMNGGWRMEDGTSHGCSGTCACWCL